MDVNGNCAKIPEDEIMVKSMTDPYEVRPLDKPPRCTVQVPGSKSITNRALILAALAQPQELSAFSSQPSAMGNVSVLENALRSDDTEVMIDSLQRLGIAVEADWSNNRITVPSIPIASWNRKVDFFCGNSGTTIRFLTAMLSVGQGTYRLDGVARMRERPIGDLLDAMKGAGVKAESEKGTDCPPVMVHAQGLPGGTVSVRGDTSSQFLSALLMAAPYAQQPLAIQIDGELVSIPYVLMTLKMMQQWSGHDDPGLTKALGQDPASWTTLQSTTHYTARQYAIEPDASSASYFWAAAAIMGGRVAIPGLSNSLQGDVAFRDGLQRRGQQQPVSSPCH